MVFFDKRKASQPHDRQRVASWDRCIVMVLLPLMVLYTVGHWMGPACNPNLAVALEGRSLSLGAKKLAGFWKTTDGSDPANGDERSKLFLGSPDPWTCDGNDAPSDCPLRRADAVFVAEGSLSTRVHAVCAAYAVTALTNMPTLSLWPADLQMPATTFRHLFRLAQDPAPSGSSSRARDESGREGTVWVQDTPVMARHLKRALKGRRRVAFKPCKSADGKQAPAADGLPFKIFLSPAVRGKTDGPVRVDVCAFEREVDTCLGLIRPSPAVAAMVVEEDLARVAASSAVLIDQLGEEGCEGCSDKSNRSAPHCAMRRVTMEYLYDPAVSFTAGAINTSDITVHNSYFSALRFPHVLKVTKLRNATCRLLEGGEEGQVKGRVNVSLGVGDEAGGEGAEGLVLQPATDRALGAHVTQCTQLQVAELFALSFARGLLAVNRSSIEARFVTAQGTSRSPSFGVYRSVCDSTELRPITKQKWAMFTQVEEKLKLMVCTMPKVACNSWLMWLRAKLGQPHPEDPILALDPHRAGWHMLTLHFTEQQAVQQVTRPDYFKFTFVRNPFSRVLSAYSNKLVITDTPNNKTGPGSREYWNEAFFKYIRPQWEKVKDTKGLVTFPNFVKLVGELMKRHRWRMDRHIASQSDICFMDKIKYDFVGRFENLEEDAKYVVNRFGGDHLDIFNFGVNAHFTNADSKLAKKYDKETYELVKKIFARDLHIPLNNITQAAPVVLVDMFEKKQKRLAHRSVNI
ncbi:hypothetical protein CLOM_g18228 [Closterium sp. NIES-68]|nr:hypothetical protein CLOM_g18228 [Closterium sp. NIES-68]